MKHKYNKQKQMRKFDAHSLALIKYEPQEILFMHKQSRKLYCYFNSSQHPKKEISHPNLLKSIAFDQGVLYPKQQTSLLKQVEIRKRARSDSQFSEQQIVNTFLPLFQCLSVLQQHKMVHGSIHLQNIVMIQGQIRLRDWHGLTKMSNQYYNQKVQLQDDIAALCCCLINCILIETSRPEHKELEKMLYVWFQKYGKCFFLVLLIFVKQLKEHYSDIVKLLEGQTKIITGKLTDYYQNFTLQKEKRKVNTNSQLSQSSLLLSQNKKMPIFSAKKATHYQNIENKVDYPQAKKLNEKAIKIFDKSAHELMTKKLNEQQKKIKEQQIKKVFKAPILSLSITGIENKSKKLHKQRTSSYGIIRSFSKKK